MTFEYLNIYPNYVAALRCNIFKLPCSSVKSSEVPCKTRTVGVVCSAAQWAVTSAAAGQPLLTSSAGIYLARSANLTEELYILPMFFFIIFKGRLSRPGSSESNGPIFTRIFRIDRRV